jgi:hypothetical protein
MTLPPPEFRALGIIAKEPATELQSKPIEVLDRLVLLRLARRDQCVTFNSNGLAEPSFRTTITSAGMAVLSSAARDQARKDRG